MGQWADLPVDLLELVEDSLVLYADKLRIRVVCLFWYDQLPKLPKRQFPWLLQPVANNNEASHALFDPVDQKFLYLDSPNLLQDKILKGSAFGWVVTIEDVYDIDNSNKFFLVNPLTSARIELPSRDKFPDIMSYQPYRVNEEYSVFSFEEGDQKSLRLYSFEKMNNDDLNNKFVMSCDPSRSDGKECVVAVIYGPHRRVACCELNDVRWNPLPIIEDAKCRTYDYIMRRRLEDIVTIENSRVRDILFSKGKLHGLLCKGRKSQVVVFENINGIKPNPKISLIANLVHDHSDPITIDSKNSFIIPQQYLVESSDGSYLMIVARYIRFTEIDKHFTIPDTCYFKVFRVDPISRMSFELNSIGDDILIVGVNTSISISSRNCIGYKRNHVYFTDPEYTYHRKDNKLEENDIGLFNLEDKTLQPLLGFKSDPKFLWPPPIWV